MHRMFRAVFGRDLFAVCGGTCTGAKNECGAMLDVANAVIGHELSHDERLLWSGQPGTGFRFQPFDWFLVPFSLMWTGFVVYAFISVLSQQPSADLFFFAPFLIVGFLILFGRYVLDSLVRRRTWYGLTDERAIIVRHWFGTKVQSLSLKTLPEITLSLSNNRSGSIFLGSASPWAMWNGMNFLSSAHSLTSPTFEVLDDARSVFEMIREAQRSAQERGAPR
jgi:hypothetical protein